MCENKKCIFDFADFFSPKLSGFMGRKKNGAKKYCIDESINKRLMAPLLILAEPNLINHVTNGLA